MKKRNPQEEIVLELVQAVENGDYPRALRIKLEPRGFYASLKRINKDKIDFWKTFAYLLSPNSPKAVIKIIQRILTLTPKDHSAQYLLANLLFESGDLKRAKTAFEKSINLSPNNPNYHNGLGNMFLYKGDLRNAERKYRDAIKIDPQFVLSYSLLGTVYERQDRYEEAEQIFRAGIRINSAVSHLHYNLGVVLERQNKLEEGEEEYRKSITLEDNNPYAHNNLANVLWELEKEDDVEKEYRKAIEILKDAPHFYLNLIRFFRSKENLDGMKNVLEEMNKNNAIDSNAYDIIGGYLVEKNNIEEAEIMFRKAIKINPKNSYPYNNLANSLHKKGNLLEAYELFNEGVKHIGSLPIRDQKQLTTNFAGFLRELGYFYCKQGNHKQTLSVVIKLIEYVDLNKVFLNLKSELLSDAHFLLGLTALKKGAPRNAIQEFQKASNYKPNDARIWYNLAHQYHILGKPYHALQATSHALEINPSYLKAKELLEIIKNSKTPRRIKWWRYLVSIVIAGLSVPAFFFSRGFLPWFILLILLICSVVFLFSPFIKTVKPKFKLLGQELELEIQPPEKSNLKIISIEDRQSLPDEPFKDNESSTP